MSQQSLRQASIRAVTSTTYTYEGDWHALWDLLGIAAGQFNERMLLYINNQLSTSYTEINGAMAAFAAEHGSTTFQAIGTFTPGFSLDALTLAWSTSATDNTPGFSVSGDSLDVAPVDAQIELQVADDVNFTPPPSDTELSAVTGNPVSMAVSPALSDGQYWARARLLDSGDTPLTDWSNVVTETIDATAPTVSSFSPADNATDVAVDTDLIVTFSEPIVLGASGTITLKKTSDDSTVDSWDVSADEGSGAGQLEVLNDDELHLHLTTDIDGELEVYVVWDAGVVEDAAGNDVAALSTTTTWSFTTDGSAFTPADLFTGGVGGAWYDFSDTANIFSDAGTTPITNGGTIQQINDKSGNGHTLSQATSGSRPAWATGGYATFDGTADHLFMNSSLDQWGASAGVSVFVLAKVNAATSRYLYGEGNSADNDSIYTLMTTQNTTATSHAVFIRLDDTTVINSGGTALQTGVFDNTKRIVGAIHTFGTGQVKPYLGGTGGSDQAATHSGVLTTDRFAVGGLLRATAGSFANIPELYQVVIVKKILDAGEITSLTTWLGTK